MEKERVEAQGIRISVMDNETSRTSSPQAHEVYKRLGFTQRGVEFRMES